MTPITDIIDQIPNDLLLHVIRNSNDFPWNFLAMKVILTRLNLKINTQGIEKSVLSDCCDELRNLMKKSTNVPNAKTDLNLILSMIEKQE